MSVDAPVIGGILLLVLIILLFSRMWIGFAMGLIGFIGFAILGGFPGAFKILSTVPYTQLKDYNMSVVPLFVLMGVIIAKMGIGEDLYRTAQAWVGQFRGGLSLATTLACAIFAAIASSSLPAILTLGKVAVPEMKKYNYSLPMATASLAASGTLGILIPPSTGFVLYSILTQNSVGKLFIAGILPGFLLTALFCCVILILTTINPASAPAGPKTTFKQKASSLKSTWSVLALIVIVIGGMYGGIFTATEGGAVGAFGAIIISIVMGRITLRNFKEALFETFRTTGMIFTLILGGYILMRFIAITNIPFAMVSLIQDLNVNRYVILALIVILYLILGMFLDIYGAVVLTVPILYPVVTALGFDPIWYGVIMVLLIEMGLVTPPVGLNVFTLSGITGVPAGAMFKGVWPYVTAMLLCVFILTVFPQIATFLPSNM
jgi:tripartite ATP-independent transporter DctM subunit